MGWIQIYDPFGHWWLFTLAAALPIMVLVGTNVPLRKLARGSAGKS